MSDDRKVVSLVEARRERRVSAGLVFNLDEAAKSTVKRGIFKGCITQEGCIVVEFPTDKGGDQREMTPEQARHLIRLLQELAMYGERRQLRLRGGDRWVPRTGPEPGTFWVRLDEKERLFEPCKIGKRRDAATCSSCERVLGEGETVYRERAPKAWEYPSWKHVRLCRGCVETPARTGMTEVHGG